jgi:hypothetical protein
MGTTRCDSELILSVYHESTSLRDSIVYSSPASAIARAPHTSLLDSQNISSDSNRFQVAPPNDPSQNISGHPNCSSLHLPTEKGASGRGFLERRERSSGPPFRQGTSDQEREHDECSEIF